MPLKDDLYELAKLRRTRNNLGLIQEQLPELREFCDTAESARELLQSVQENLDELIGAIQEDDNPLMPWTVQVREAGEIFLEALPKDLEAFDEMITSAEAYAEEYESCLDDKDLSADERQEIWDSLCGVLFDLADSMS